MKWLAWILLVLGIFYFLPHSIHLATSLDFGLSHRGHLIIAIISSVIAIILFIRRGGG